MKQMTDTAVTTQTDGEASLERPGGPGEARYTAPREQTKALPAGTLFPMIHTETILAGARDGKKFLALPLFDGTDDNGAQDSSVVILDWKPPAQAKFPMLSPLPSTSTATSTTSTTSTTTPTPATPPAVSLVVSAPASVRPAGGPLSPRTSLTMKRTEPLDPNAVCQLVPNKAAVRSSAALLGYIEHS